MKRYRNREIWDFEHELVVAAHGNNGLNGGGDVYLNGGIDGLKVILGIDGGTTSTVCVCMSLLPFALPLPDPLPILARAVGGCSNHNSVGGISVSLHVCIFTFFVLRQLCSFGFCLPCCSWKICAHVVKFSLVPWWNNMVG